MDCGPTCLKMVCAYYGQKIRLQTIREHFKISKDGASLYYLYGIASAAEYLGFHATGAHILFQTNFSILNA